MLFCFLIYCVQYVSILYHDLSGAHSIMIASHVKTTPPYHITIDQWRHHILYNYSLLGTILYGKRRVTETMGSEITNTIYSTVMNMIRRWSIYSVVDFLIKDLQGSGQEMACNQRNLVSMNTLRFTCRSIKGMLPVLLHLHCTDEMDKQ